MMRPSEDLPSPMSNELVTIAMLREQRRYSDILAITSRFPTSQLILIPHLLLAHAGSLSHLRRHGEALAVLLEGEREVRDCGESFVIGSWKLLLAIQFVHAGQLTAATTLLFEAVEIAERQHFAKLLADASNSLGVCSSFRGEVEDAIIFFRRSLLAWQRLGDARGVAFAHHNIGLVLREWGHPQRAEPHFRHADIYYTLDGIGEERVTLLAERALLYSDLGDERLSKHLAARAIETSQTLSAAVRASALRAYGIVSCKYDNATDGAGALKTALSVLGSEQAGLLRGEILEELAVIGAIEGWPDADEYLNEAAAAYFKLGSVRHAARLLARTKRKILPEVLRATDA